MSRTCRRPTDLCDPDRFTRRVMADYDLKHAYCRCCGDEIAYEIGEDGTPDWYCRPCDRARRGLPPEPVVDQGVLFA